MRHVLAVIFALIATPVLAQDWGHYANPRFGYSIDVPPGFEPDQSSDNGDGTSYYRAQGAMALYVWGTNIVDVDFEAEVAAAMTYIENSDEGWTLTYRATTPGWASFSGTKSGQVFYQRMVLLCDRQSWAAFHVEYATKDIAAMDSVINRLVGSLKGICG